MCCDLMCCILQFTRMVEMERVARNEDVEFEQAQIAK